MGFHAPMIFNFPVTVSTVAFVSVLGTSGVKGCLLGHILFILGRPVAVVRIISR